MIACTLISIIRLFSQCIEHETKRKICVMVGQTNELGGMLGSPTCIWLSTGLRNKIWTARSTMARLDQFLYLWINFDLFFARSLETRSNSILFCSISNRVLVQTFFFVVWSNFVFFSILKQAIKPNLGRLDHDKILIISYISIKQVFA